MSFTSGVLPMAERMLGHDGGQFDRAGEGPVEWAMKDGFFLDSEEDGLLTLGMVCYNIVLFGMRRDAR